ncbi:hypothetical protein N0H69_18920 [Yersinia alsatica]|uniref:Phage protein n=1 Tax=Yersinia alsatica TaxID=2890317 RepID=A0ABY5UQ79_9GAMM|nr:hypothetical protein [Yersinia alsatica]OWF68919.1 hypothetical protein B4901_10080 [Yersinia frederiksenii]UWM44700.1 hypothetical protein N0H69_18920 [Yersinia alsatica]CNK95460.1 Uncharacterised protein [Yersinia frederiksenii]CNL71261.1 Uncharacterised protein [Yersinia frederiksenii]
MDKHIEEFEAFMAERFGDSIDRRKCLNGDDNDYMAWDMQVAKIIWMQLAAKLEAANQIIEANNEGDLENTQLMNLAAYSATLRCRAEASEQRFDDLAKAAGWTPERCEQTGDSPFDAVEGLFADRVRAEQRAKAAEARLLVPVKSPDDGLEDCISMWPDNWRNDFDTGYNFGVWRCEQNIKAAGYPVEGGE